MGGSVSPNTDPPGGLERPLLIIVRGCRYKICMMHKIALALHNFARYNQTHEDKPT
jgi:hypothetical protein